MGAKVSAILTGTRILLVEDEFLLALDMESAIRSAGAEVVGPLETVAAASEAADVEDLDAAVLDLNLRGAMSFPVAAVLERRRIPFLFATGYDVSRLPDHLRRTPCLRKPFNGNELAVALTRLIRPELW